MSFLDRVNIGQARLAGLERGACRLLVPEISK